MFDCIFICLWVNTIKLLFSGAVVRNKAVSTEESLYALFNISTERFKNVLVEHKTMLLAYKRSWKLGEVKTWQMDEM